VAHGLRSFLRSTIVRRGLRVALPEKHMVNRKLRS
jgi:hypothetical protein